MKNKSVLVLFITALLSNTTVFADAMVKKTTTSLNERTDALEYKMHLLQNKIDKMQNSSQPQFNSPLEMYAHGPAIVTSPLLGVRRPEDSHSNLMVKLPAINEDMILLGIRQKMDNYAKKNGISTPGRPIIALSGSIEAQVEYKDNDSYSKTSKADINLSGAQLDIIAEPCPWVTGAMIITYDDKPGSKGSGAETRAANSRVQLSRGFLTFGQLNKSPVYLTIGQAYAPFGNYGSYGVTKPSTRALGRTKDRMAILGYNQFGVWAQVYGLAGDTKSTGAEFIKHMGFNLGYKYDHGDDFMIIVGGGILGNLAESQGMQDKVFNKGLAAETISSHILGLNAHVKFAFHKAFTIQAEYVGASKAFNLSDLMFNKHGAKPQALNVECGYNFTTLQKPSAMFAGYGLTSQALALGLPKHSFFAGYNVSLIKYTIASIEYRHNINYGWNDIAGAGPNRPSVTTKVTGRHCNTVLAEIGIYF